MMKVAVQINFEIRQNTVTTMDSSGLLAMIALTRRLSVFTIKRRV